MSTRHVVLVAAFFPPSRGSGVYRSLGTANHLARLGWRVTVITVTPEFFDDVTGSRDDHLLDTIDPQVTVERVHLPYQHLLRDVRTMSFWRANLPVASTLPARLARRFFPDRYATWIPGVVARIAAVHRRAPVDVLLASGNPWSSFEAVRLAGRLIRRPYALDYRDSWTLDQFAEAPAFADGSPEVAAERRLVEGAARVVFVNEAMREWHATRYPAAADRMVVVENGYDPETLGAVAAEPPPAERALRFGYVGTVTAKLPHAETWAGWRLARERDPELARATAHLYGHLGFFPADADALRLLVPGPAEGVVLEGPVSKTDVARAYSDLDVILLMIPPSRFVTAGKTYETLATAKPVVAIHTPETAASEPMRGYPLVFPVPELTAEAVADALVAAARAARSVTADQVAACRDHALGYRREVQVARLDDELRAVTRG